MGELDKKALDEKSFTSSENSSEIAFSFDESIVPEDCFIVAEASGDRAFYKSGTLDMHSANDRISAVKNADGTFTLTANAYVHTIKLLGGEPYENNWFSLMPNESVTIPTDKFIVYSI